MLHILFYYPEDAFESIKRVFVGADSDGVDAHGDDWVVVAARLGHVAKIKHVGFLDVKLFEEMSHAKFLIHAGSGNVDGSGATDFVKEIGQFFAAFLDDGLALFEIGIPGIFGLGASLLAKRRESNLGEAVFDDFVTVGKFISFPKAKFTSSFFQNCCNFYNIFRLERVIIDLLPIGRVVGVGACLIVIILSALSNEKTQILETLKKFGRIIGDFGDWVDNLDEKLLEFLAGNRADVKMVETLAQNFGHFGRNGSLGDVKGLINIKC